YVISAICQLTRFAFLILIPDKQEVTIAKALFEIIFSIFGAPEILHSDQGLEFENRLVLELQIKVDFKN
ncbi:unnamed protein product, partial [Choristocarpus tenellus]